VYANGNGSDILTGWKSIAGFLHVSIRQARSLMKNEGLPVNKKGGNVFATKKKLEEWVYEAKNSSAENIT
jgi:hypothetical protein